MLSSSSSSSSAPSSSSSSCHTSPHFFHPCWPPPPPPHLSADLSPPLFCWDFALFNTPTPPTFVPQINGLAICPTSSSSTSPSFSPSSSNNDKVPRNSATSSAKVAAPHKSGGGCSRRYKTPSPQLLRVRREAANARERRRMNHLNTAFEKLRSVLPPYDNGRRLSKFETLLWAQFYMEGLGGILNGGGRGRGTMKEQLEDIAILAQRQMQMSQATRSPK